MPVSAGRPGAPELADIRVTGEPDYDEAPCLFAAALTGRVLPEVEVRSFWVSGASEPAAEILLDNSLAVAFGLESGSTGSLTQMVGHDCETITWRNRTFNPDGTVDELSESGFTVGGPR